MSFDVTESRYPYDLESWCGWMFDNTYKQYCLYDMGKIKYVFKRKTIQ